MQTMAWKLTSEKMWAIGCVGIVLVLIAVFMAYPIVSLFLHSFSDWDGVRGTYVGLRNYLDILGSDEFWLLLRNNAIMLLSIPIQVVLGFILSQLLYEQTFGWKAFRNIFFFPYLIAPMVVGFLFMNFFKNDGPLNYVFRAVGLRFTAIDWMASGWSARLVCVLAITWLNFGAAVVIFLAGMSAIPPSIFESARLDGAKRRHVIISITFPLLVKNVEFFVVTSVIYIFNGLFALIFSLSNGGPGYETTTIEYMIYLKAFLGTRMGYACAIAVILLVILVLVSRLQIALGNRSTAWAQ
jgi:multiple sugar transport system permease protein